jgi:hypothetical protein
LFCAIVESPFLSFDLVFAMQVCILRSSLNVKGRAAILAALLEKA